MKKGLFLFSLLGFLAVLTSCNNCISGNGEMNTKMMTIGEITKVRLSGDADLFLVNDSNNTLKIEGESNIIDLYEFNESGNTIKIGPKECIANSKKVKITMSMQEVESLTLKGSGNITSVTPLKAYDVDINVNGSGDVFLDVQAINVSSRINGSGDINLKGATQNHRLHINGSGSIIAPELASARANSTINGSGDCRIMVSSALNVIIRGSGSVLYTGTPDVASDVKGSGSVSKVK